MDVPYVWSESTPGFGRWAKLNELNGDPKFKDSVLKPDPEDIRAKEIAENEKFEKERQEKEAKREEKLLRKRLHIIGSN